MWSFHPHIDSQLNFQIIYWITIYCISKMEDLIYIEQLRCPVLKTGHNNLKYAPYPYDL